MNDVLYGRLLETLSTKGYDVSRLVKTSQPEDL